MKVMFSKMETVDLERIHMLLDLMVQEHGGIVTGEFLSPEDFHSKSLDEIVAKLSALPN
jgi:hypothetical protein